MNNQYTLTSALSFFLQTQSLPSSSRYKYGNLPQKHKWNKIKSNHTDLANWPCSCCHKTKHQPTDFLNITWLNQIRGHFQLLSTFPPNNYMDEKYKKLLQLLLAKQPTPDALK
jgi:hypothetical protein